MSELLSTTLDLTLAWRRVKDDIPGRVFIRHPFEISIIEQDREAWLNRLKESIRDGHYNPGPSIICDAPKGKGTVRPGAHLAMADRVVFAACVGACFQNIHRHLHWSQGTVDYSYRLAVNPDSPGWLRNQFEGWRDFRNRSLAKLDEGVPYVVVADITAYYENVDISLIISDLRQIGCDQEVLNLLSSCLNRWAQVNGRGIPQGHSPSDILGKLYLNNIDQSLLDMEYTHVRYVDDIRIFCRNAVEAKKALVDLARLLRKRGLNLQSAKSEILRSDDARREIEGVIPILANVRRNFMEQVIQALGEANPYISLTKAEELLAKSPEEAPIEFIREAYQAYFIDSADSSFDKTLFHFLLKRLAVQNDTFGVNHCKTLFDKHPEETDYILSYFKAVQAVDSVEVDLVTFLNSPDAVYTYQNYQILEWFSILDHIPSDGLIAIARQFAFDNAQPPYLRAVCRKILGDHGTPADLERLEGDYAEARNPLEQCEIICSLRRMEVARRNTFLRRAERDGFLNRNAARLVRSAGA
jgi:hypothetical protein